MSFPAPVVHAGGFVARSTFAASSSTLRSYYLGHHKAGLDKMKRLISQIDLVIECRDYRVPITSKNPEFESSLGLGSKDSKPRIIVFTKQDLGVESDAKHQMEARNKERLIKSFHHPDQVHFSSKSEAIQKLLGQVKEHVRRNFSLTGHRILVAGIPNVGKSTLINALCKFGGQRKSKVAQTGADPGVTRKIGTAIKVFNAEAIRDKENEKHASRGEGVYVLDTPGVFMPYVPDIEAMLKLALCGSVKDNLIPSVTIADYLLYTINRRGLQATYSEFSEPTNSVADLIDKIARRIGRLGKGGAPDHEGTALWFIKRWRQGRMGKFMLDDIDEQSLSRSRSTETGQVSWNQAMKQERERRRQQATERFSAG